LFPALAGAVITGHVQSGDVIPRVFKHPFPSVTVTVILVPVGTNVTLHTLPIVFTTVPVVLVTVPPLTVTSSEYVSRFAAHVGPEVSDIVGSAFITTVIVVVVAHSPAVGVNVYTVDPADAVLIVAGDQVPVMLLFDVVGKVPGVAPTQYGPNCVKIGVILAFTVILFVVGTVAVQLFALV